MHKRPHGPQNLIVRHCTDEVAIANIERGLIELAASKLDYEKDCVNRLVSKDQFLEFQRSVTQG